jgi:hypothetical protein
MRIKIPQGTQYQISKDGIPRRYCDRKDIASQTARFLKSQNPNSTHTERLAHGRRNGCGVQAGRITKP